MNRKPKYLKQLSRRLMLIRSVETLLLTLAVGFLSWSVFVWLSVNLLVSIIATMSIMIFVGWLLARSKNLFSSNVQYLVSFLNSSYPELEESTDLLLQDSTQLNLLQQIQQARVQNRLDQLYPQVKLPNAWRTTGIVVIACVLVSVLLMSFNPTSGPIETRLQHEIKELNQAAEKIKVESIAVTITPPAYTGKPASTATDLHLAVPEGSTVRWQVTFSKEAQAALVFSGRDTVLLSSANKYTYSKKISKEGFYQLTWKNENDWIRSDYYKIEVIKDQEPKLEITNLEQFTRFEFNTTLNVLVKASLQDDYGLADASVIATVAKGSGESVKFREEKLKFDSPSRINGKQINASITLDLIKLGMEPGDELYFYVEANDVKTPVANYNRTETYFIAIQDTTTYEAVDEEGLGVDLMPEYFRSQRQIIIDTEKLLKEKKKITQQQFKFTSNELGYDQKVLRLRYGQFMGEEFEDQIGGATLSPEELDPDETAEETAQRMSHQHDTENEHNLVEQKKPVADNHGHDGEESDDPLAAFAHQHDDGETATFFIESMRTKLKAALTVMWDAELYLRLYEPEKSLPYQYTALKLLKEISNDSRIYVHRTGFDPPPLKEEKRLSGDLTEIKSNTGLSKQLTKQQYPAISEAQQLLERLLLNNTKPNAADKAILTLAGGELSGVALEQPGKYLHGLSVLKNMAEGKVPDQEWHNSLVVLRKVFWQIVPPDSETPSQKKQAMHALDQQFLQSLNE